MKAVEKVLVSIIIPCYNDAEYIEQSVHSALNQKYQNKEVIVVDDGSNKATKLVLETLKPKLTKLITQENKGQSSARNLGIAHAKGEYILVLDSDDFFEPTFSEKAIQIFENEENIKVVSCYAKLIGNNLKNRIFEPKGGELKNFLVSNEVLGTSMFKKQDWESVNGYDESMRSGFEDWEYFIRLLKNGGEAFVIKEPLFNYRQRFGSTTSRANKNKYNLLEYIYLKHKDVYVDNYESFITFLLSKIEREEQEKIKKENHLEYRIGAFVLKPLKFVKRLFL
ncbi:glycosyltransferase family 2 protein [Thalassobellus citreus]|uniref:glycosyltransferase family 2 protein n=1 Tax=Thalassobellus citreus TaxID=3367752 RepID=UPI00379A5DB2